MIYAVRASYLPTLIACPAAGPEGPGIMVSTSGESAELGNAVHEVLAHEVTGRRRDWDEVAASYGVNKGELAGLCAAGVRMWKDGLRDRHNMTDLRTEVELRTTLCGADGTRVVLSGHLDAYSRTYRTGHIEDWKSGYKDASYRWQMLGYCYLALATDESLETANARVVWLRTKEVENYSMTRDTMADFREAVLESVHWDGDSYRPGPHCGYCPRNSSCQARTQEERQALAVIGREEDASLDNMERTLEAMTGPELVSFLRLTKSVETRAKLVREKVRELVEKRGEVDAGDGYKLVLESEEKREIDPVKAWPVLQSQLSDDELASCISIGAGKVDTAVAKKAPRGLGAQAKRDMEQKLIDAGALTKNITKKMVERRK